MIANTSEKLPTQCFPRSWSQSGRFICSHFKFLQTGCNLSVSEQASLIFVGSLCVRLLWTSHWMNRQREGRKLSTSYRQQEPQLAVARCRGQCCLVRWRGVIEVHQADETGLRHSPTWLRVSLCLTRTWPVTAEILRSKRQKGREWKSEILINETKLWWPISVPPTNWDRSVRIQFETSIFGILCVFFVKIHILRWTYLQ
jgi:hypothetical protein